MTDARNTQIALEQWGDGSPVARTTQVAVEQWGSTSSGNPGAVLTQIAVEQWAKVDAVVPPVVGHYWGVAERWDRGHWDVAHWDGQLGISPPAGQVVISGADARLLLVRGIRLDPLQVTVIGNDANLFPALSYPFPVETTAIVVSGGDTTIVSAHYSMRAEPAATMVIDGKVASLVLGNTMPPPGFLEFGIPRVIVPHHW